MVFHFLHLFVYNSLAVVSSAYPVQHAGRGTLPAPSDTPPACPTARLTTAAHSAEGGPEASLHSQTGHFLHHLTDKIRNKPSGPSASAHLLRVQHLRDTTHNSLFIRQINGHETSRTLHFKLVPRGAESCSRGDGWSTSIGESSLWAAWASETDCISDCRQRRQDGEGQRSTCYRTLHFHWCCHA